MHTFDHRGSSSEAREHRTLSRGPAALTSSKTPLPHRKANLIEACRACQPKVVSRTICFWRSWHTTTLIIAIIGFGGWTFRVFGTILKVFSRLFSLLWTARLSPQNSGTSFVLTPITLFYMQRLPSLVGARNRSNRTYAAHPRDGSANWLSIRCMLSYHSLIDHLLIDIYGLTGRNSSEQYQRDRGTRLPSLGKSAR